MLSLCPLALRIAGSISLGAPGPIGDDDLPSPESIRPLNLSIDSFGNASLSWWGRSLVGMLVSLGGVEFPRSACSHSGRRLAEAGAAASFGEGGAQVSLLAGLESGVRCVWKASGAGALLSGDGVATQAGSAWGDRGWHPLAISSAADQLVLVDDRVAADPSRQAFLRNILHHLIRASGSLPEAHLEPTAAPSSGHRGLWNPQRDVLVQVQCSLIILEGLLASSTSPGDGRAFQPRAWSGVLVADTAGSVELGGLASGIDPLEGHSRLTDCGAACVGCLPVLGKGSGVKADARSIGVGRRVSSLEEESHGREARKVAKSLLEVRSIRARYAGVAPGTGRLPPERSRAVDWLPWCGRVCR